MSTKNYFAISFLLIICINVSAQSSNDLIPAEFIAQQKGITTRLNFTGILDGSDQNISIGGEYLFADHWSAGSDVAYIFYSGYLSKSESSRGFILRPFIRYYPENGRNGFFEAGLHHKHVSYKITDWVGKDIIDGQPSYEKYETFHYIKNAYEFNLKAGTAANLSRNKKFRLEFYAGLGIRFKIQGADNGTYYESGNLLSSIYQSRYSTIVVPMGMRLVYDLK